MSGAMVAAAGVAAAAGGPVPNLTNRTVSDVVAGSTAIAVYSLASNGQASQTTNSGGTVNYTNEWLKPVTNGFGAVYACRFTVNSGATPTGDSTGVWLALSSNRSWTNTRGSVGTTTTSATVEIRRVSDSVVVATMSLTLSAQWV